MVAGIIILTGILFTALLLYVHIAHPLSFYTFLGRYIKRVMEAFNAKFLIQSNGLFVPKDILVKPVQINKYCSGEWIYHKQFDGHVDNGDDTRGSSTNDDSTSTETFENKCALLYLHGGAYHGGSALTHRLLTVQLARRGAAFGLRILCINYRLAPRHKFPAAIDDAIDALSFLHGYYSPSRIAVMGDSAGGGLAFATCLRAWQLGIPGPASLVAFSPWTDLLVTGASMRTNAGTDIMFSPYHSGANRFCFGAYRPCMGTANEIQGEVLVRSFRSFAKSYAGSSVQDPLASPLNASIAMLKDAMPPTHIVVSTAEVLLDDGTRMYDKMRQAGVYVTIEHYRDEIHVFPAFKHSPGSNGSHALDAAAEHINKSINKKLRTNELKDGDQQKAEKQWTKSKFSLSSIRQNLSKKFSIKKETSQ